MHRWRRLNVSVLVAVLLFAFRPAHAQDTLPQTEITLFFHSARGAERDALVESLNIFNVAQPDYRAVPEELPEGSYTALVEEAARAGGLPCLLDFDGPTLYNFVYNGYLIPIDDYVSDALRADLLPSIIDQGTYNDRLYSLGQFDSGLSLWGNRRYLAAAGVRIPAGVADTWTLDEFNAALAALSRVEGVEYALDLKLQYGQGEWYTYGFSPILQSFGGDLIDRTDFQSADGVLNGAAGLAFGTWLQGLFASGYADPTPPDDEQFVSGNAALSFVGHWEYPRYQRALGDDLVLIPMPDFGTGAKTGSGSWNWGITSSCAHPDGAWALLEYLLSPGSIAAMTSVNGAIPSRLSVLDDDERFAPGGSLAVYYDQLVTGLAVPRPQTAAYPTITTAFAAAIADIVAGADVQTALDTAVARIDRDIAANDGYQTP